MNGLTINDFTRLNFLISKIKVRTATLVEMQEFLSLIEKSGQNNFLELQNYLNAAGYSNIEEFKQHLNQKQTEVLIDGLVKIGLAILLGYALLQMAKNK